MADRPTMSTSRAGRPRMRSKSVHLPSHIPVASKAGKHRTASAQKIPTKGKGAGKGKKDTNKSNKAVVLVSSDSEDLEVDFLHCHPNQPHEVPAELPQQPNLPVDVPTEEQQELDHPADDPIEEHPANAPSEDIEQPQNPGNPNPLPVQPHVPMANNQLNWSHFRPEFSETPNEDAEAHLLRMEDWMTTHNFPEDHKVGRICLTLTGEARLWYATLNIQQQQLNWDSSQERFRQQYCKFGKT